MTTTTQDSPITYSAILNPDEVAKLLQVPVRTLEECRHKKTGPPYRRLGRHVRYQFSKIMDWFENND